MTWLVPLTLNGTHVILEPLSYNHHDDLIDAVKDGELWNLHYTWIPAPEAMRDEIAKRLDLQRQGTMLPFAVISNATRKAVGMTTYMNVDSDNKHVEIGSTWYRKNVQQTALNTEAKYLLLQHAFESLDCIAVEFRTAFLNFQSRRAIERIGAKLDGVLRNHRFAANGIVRDTCVYSIISSEWLGIKSYLTLKMQQSK